MEVDKPTPVMLDGKVECFMPKINGKPWRCACGANVMIKPDDKDLELYQCNGCESLYRGS